MPKGFLRSWVAANVKPVPRAEHSNEAVRLSANCLADAAMLGIPLEALEAAAGSDMVTFMRRQLRSLAPSD
jgi:hypothetical protein